MGNFYQTGIITTLHRSGKGNLRKLESELQECTRPRRIILVLPALPLDVEERYLKVTIEELMHVSYLGQILVTLGESERRDFKRAQRMFSVLSQRKRL
jgi:glucosyl-3-phosphoglycerate synthase